MKKLMKRIQDRTGLTLVEGLVAMIVVVGALALLGSAIAADLKYNDLPQTGDSDLILRNKLAVAAARLEHGDAWKHISTNGTVNIAGPVTLSRVVVGTAGTNSKITLSEVTAGATNTVAEITTTAQGSHEIHARIAGTLRAVTAGDGAAKVTLTYR